jgi:16S rRNA (uracil1498-N3)-methyltransferase
VLLDDLESHHALKVLRLHGGAAVELFDGRGRVGRGLVRGNAETPRGERNPRVLVALEQVQDVEPARPALDLAVAMPKGPRADDMVEQLSQAGVDRLIPLHTRRGVVLPGAGKLARFNRAVVESAKQCRRNYLMLVTDPCTLDEVLAQGHDLRLLADAPGAESGTNPGAELFRAARRVLILVGPEGGWAPEERQVADRAGCHRWRLGPHVLRIETAALAAAAVARYLAS